MMVFNFWTTSGKINFSFSIWHANLLSYFLKKFAWKRDMYTISDQHTEKCSAKIPKYQNQKSTHFILDLWRVQWYSFMIQFINILLISDEWIVYIMSRKDKQIPKKKNS